MRSNFYYKSLKKVLKWISYLMHNKKYLIKRLHSAFVFSNFDMKSSFWQVQIDEKNH